MTWHENARRGDLHKSSSSLTRHLRSVAAEVLNIQSCKMPTNSAFVHVQNRCHSNMAGGWMNLLPAGISKILTPGHFITRHRHHASIAQTKTGRWKPGAWRAGTSPHCWAALFLTLKNLIQVDATTSNIQAGRRATPTPLLQQMNEVHRSRRKFWAVNFDLTRDTKSPVLWKGFLRHNPLLQFFCLFVC